MVNPWAGMLLMVGLFTALTTALRVYRRKFAPHPELLRKLLHVGMGLVTLTFPWLFERAWPVVLLAAVFTGLLIALKTSASLQRNLGGIVDGVARESSGEIYFPVSVGILFVLSGGHALFFCVPMLLLTLADAVAALVGERYGLSRYEATEGEKSAEGSLACFTVAFLSTHVPLLLFSNTGRAESLLIGLILGLLVTLLEAIAWRGVDNLLIPLGGFILLKTNLEMSIGALVARLVVTLALLLFVLAWRRRTALSESAVLGAAFFGYLCWAVGGWQWVVPPLVLFITHVLLSPKAEPRYIGGRRLHNIQAVFSVSFAGLVWLLLAKTLSRPEFYYPYALSFAAHLAMIGIARLKFTYPRMSGIILVGTCIAKSWLLIFVPFLLIAGATRTSLFCTLCAPVVIGIAAIVFYGTQPDLHNYPTDRRRWQRQAFVAAAASIVGLIPLAVIEYYANTIIYWLISYPWR